MCPGLRGLMMAKFGPDLKKWPQPGCSANFYPWRFGPSTVLEFQTAAGEWRAFRADKMPEKLDDVVKAHQVARG